MQKKPLEFSSNLINLISFQTFEQKKKGNK